MSEGSCVAHWSRRPRGRVRPGKRARYPRGAPDHRGETPGRVRRNSPGILWEFPHEWPVRCRMYKEGPGPHGSLSIDRPDICVLPFNGWSSFKTIVRFAAAAGPRISVLIPYNLSAVDNEATMLGGHQRHFRSPAQVCPAPDPSGSMQAWKWGREMFGFVHQRTHASTYGTGAGPTEVTTTLAMYDPPPTRRLRLRSREGVSECSGQ